MTEKPFDGIVGNDLVKHYLTQMLKKKTIGNLFLFSGINGIGKSLFAMSFVKGLLNVESLHNQPDVYIYRPEGKTGMHSIESMRQMCEKVYLAPFALKRKVFIIEHAEKMLPSGANALLKTFEEPSVDSVIILISSQKQALLPTVLSRCQAVSFSHIAEEEIKNFLIQKLNKNEKEACVWASLAQGSIGKAIQLASGESDLIQQKVLEILTTGGFKLYNDLVSASQNIFQLVEELKKREESLMTESFTNSRGSDLTASQLQILNKEIEGAVAMKQAEMALSIFDQILFWYRDLHVLKSGADPSYLIHRHCLESLEQFLKTGKILSIESVQKMIMQAKLLLDRSTSLNIVLENFFLKLGLI